MKNTLLARPNLKMFLLGAILIALAHEFCSKNLVQASAPLILAGRGQQYEEITQLLQEVSQQPSSEVYLKISNCFERLGHTNRARLYLQKAGDYAQFEETAQ